MPDKKAFTLIELLIVIGIIAILASGVIVAINPGRQFAQARDATRESHINTLHKALISYQVDNQGNLSGLPITSTPTEICNTSLDTPDCTSADGDLINLSDLVNGEYINQIPIDPQGSVATDADGTGYFVAEGSIILVADKAETRFIGIGTTESEYAGEGFACGDNLDYEGQTYGTVDINGQCWMAENLNYSGHTSGTSWCYENNAANCDTYGRLYNWDAAMDGVTTEGSQGACPTGWHIPTDSEWHTLENYLTADGNTCDGTRSGVYDCDPAGGKLKEAGTTHWSSETCGTATCNSSGFTALPGGNRFTSGSFYYLGSRGYWWSSTEDGTDAWGRSLHSSLSDVLRYSHDQANGYSVRCLRD